jgi:predicted ribosome quality control (RQC) complex YloA/Tae2 family protein
MDNVYLAALVREIEPAITNRTVAKIAFAGATLRLDLRLPSERLLLASLAPANPALYLTGNSAKPPHSEANAAHPFAAQLRKHLTGAKLMAITKSLTDRIVRLDFEGFDASGDRVRSALVLAFTGRAANAFIVDGKQNLLATLRDRATLPDLPPHATAEPPPAAILPGDLQESLSQSEILEHYFGTQSSFSPVYKNEFLARCRSMNPAAALRSIVSDIFDNAPTPLVYSRHALEASGQRLMNLKSDLLLSSIELIQAANLMRHEFPSLSEAAEAYDEARARQLEFQAIYNSVRQLLAQEIKKRDTTLQAIEQDRQRFAEPEKMKHYGDLLLANLATARVAGTSATVVDYYDPEQSEITIDLGEHRTLQQAAADYFARYQKAQRALTAIAARQKEVAQGLQPLKELLNQLEAEPSHERITAIRLEAERQLGLSPQRRGKQQKSGGQKGGAIGKRFKTSDGFEVAVGKNDRDNEALTFRLAKPQDVWMHAADYPGSHVIIRNPNRAEIPHRSLVEAAELAAFYSQAKHTGKAAVHYTQKKFVTKPPRAKPGLVRLSSFKTVLVEPRCTLQRMD